MSGPEPFHQRGRHVQKAHGRRTSMGAEGEHLSGGMIALIPTVQDAKRLAIKGGERAEDLHLTLYFLGDDGSAFSAEAQKAVVESVRGMVPQYVKGPVTAKVFGVAHWNGGGESPSWVWNVGDDPRTPRTLGMIHSAIVMALEEALDETVEHPEIPQQHSPWAAHVCAAYTGDLTLVTVLEERNGEIVFDRVRVSFGDEDTDIPLAGDRKGEAVRGAILHDEVIEVPWKVIRGAGCNDRKPWAVVRKGTDEVEGCHPTRDAANKQMAALYANEGKASVTTAATEEKDRTELGGKPNRGTHPDKRLKENDYAEGDCPEGMEKGPDGKCVPGQAEEYAVVGDEHFGPSQSVSGSPWNGAASRFSDDQYRMSAAGCDPGGTPKESCFLPHHEPGGSLNKSGLSAAAGRANQLSGRSAGAVARAKSHLRGHYRANGWDVPENLQASQEEIDAFGVEEGYDGTVWLSEKAVDSFDPPEIDTARTAPWRGPLVVEDKWTGDGRRFAAGEIAWQDPPIPLRWNKEDSHGGAPHTVTVNVGRIDRIWRDGDQIMGEGLLDLSTEDGDTVHGKIKGKFLRGVSIDADDIEAADVEFVFPDEMDDDDPLAALFTEPKKIYHGGRIRAATLCDIPAFVEAYIELLDEAGAVVASGRMDSSEWRAAYEERRAAGGETRRTDPRPPEEWFTDPGFSVLTGITVTEEGRVYGHAAEWNACHIGYEGVCTTAPREEEHPHFMTGEVSTREGTSVSVGQITVGTGHAPLDAGARAAMEHYDNTGSVVADVVVGNDEYGIWVAGAVRPGATPMQVHALRAAGRVSGDWRRIGGQLRLVGLLAVNVAGFNFAQPRMKTRLQGTTQLALVAAGRLSLLPPSTEEDLDRWAMDRVMDMVERRIQGKEV